MLLDRQNLAAHRPWIIAVAAATLASGAWYFLTAAAAPRWPGGASLPGLVLGTIAALLIVFEFLLWPRKKLRWLRVGRAQTWLRAHIWLGLLVGPLAVLHSGFRFGGLLSTVLMVLLLVVLASGVFGLAMQQWIPRRLLRDVPAETIYSQIEYIADQYAADAQRLVEAVCGAADDAADDDTPSAILPGDHSGHLVIGQLRTVGRVQGKALRTIERGKAIRNADLLIAAQREVVGPYLRDGAKTASLAADAARASDFFRDLRARLDPAVHPVVDSLEEWCDYRRQFDLQARLHWWLHSWLCVHLPLSLALLLVLAVHIVAALRYW